jgi:general stress protein YciG
MTDNTPQSNEQFTESNLAATNENKQSGIINRGFAAMDENKRKQIASKGGEAVSQNREHMAEIGRKGGEAVSRNKKHMAEIGRKGGEASRNALRKNSGLNLDGDQRIGDMQ